MSVHLPLFTFSKKHSPQSQAVITALALEGVLIDYPPLEKAYLTAQKASAKAQYAHFLCGRKCKNKRERERLENERVKAQIEAEKQQAAFDLKLKQGLRKQSELQNQLLQMKMQLEDKTERELTKIALEREKMALENEKQEAAAAQAQKGKLTIYAMGAVILITLVTTLVLVFKK